MPPKTKTLDIDLKSTDIKNVDQIDTSNLRVVDVGQVNKSMECSHIHYWSTAFAVLADEYLDKKKAEESLPK